MVKLNIVCWNCEDFFVYRKLRTLYENRISNQTLKDQLEFTSIIDRLQEAHIILLQEWNDDNGDFVKTYLSKYGILNQDRTAILYKKKTFEKNVRSVEIPLLHEPPTRIERTYTTGRQKSNIFARLFYQTTPIYIGCFHLSAFSPSQHPGFHKRQLNDYLNKCMNTELFRRGGHDNSEYYNSELVPSLEGKYGFIVGGDTNFNDGRDHSNLFEDLINNEIVQRLKLSDVCRGTCNTLTTQDPQCMHETDVGKTVAKFVSKLKDYTSRLDLLMVNETIIPRRTTRVIKDCNISDHSLISCKTTFELDAKLELRESGKTEKKRRKKTKKNKEKSLIISYI
jgi:hypothetical protein